MTDEKELANACLVTSTGLIREDIESGETYVGPLHIRRGENGTWDVYKESDGVQTYVDTLQPGEFGSAQILGAYLKRLAQQNAGEALPKSGGHMGQLLE